MTIGEYAEKWAVVESRALEKLPNPQPFQYEFRSWRLEIFYEWAKDDKDSPIAEALRDGVPDDQVFGEFSNAYSDMLAILHKFK
jgi:hypothetical protein